MNDHSIEGQKLIGNQFRGRTYEVRRSDVLVTVNMNFNHHDEVNSDEHNDQYHTQPHRPPKYQPKSLAQMSRQHPIAYMIHTFL